MNIYLLPYCEENIILQREQYYIDSLKPYYNTLKFAGNTIGFKHSEETKLKISASSLGRVHSEEVKKTLSKVNLGENNPMFGKSHSDEVKLLQSQVAKARTKLHNAKPAVSADSNHNLIRV